MNDPRWSWGEGLNASLRAYMTSPDATALEGAEETTSPLARLDLDIVQEWLQPPARIADLGCGTGRVALAMAARGFTVVGVDLSRPRLQAMARRRTPEMTLLPVVANLCRLDGLATGQFDAALLMYSTLGMVRGVENRRRVLREARRILRPGGRLIVHAHNFWANLHSSSIGPRIRAAGLPGQGWLDRLGDCRMRYAGVPDLEIHVYRGGELRRVLRESGFRPLQTVALDRGSGRRLSGLPRWFRPADGWIVRAEAR